MLTANPSPTPTKAEYDKSYRAKRKARKHELIELHQVVITNQQEDTPNFTIGFSCRRLLRSGEVINLPHEYAFILKACQEFIDNPQRFPGLFAWGGAAVNNVQCRTLIAKTLACILPNTDLIGGRIGMPTEAGLKTISYDQLQEDYVLRWGEYISPKSFAKVMKYLKRASYIYTERINVCVDDENGTVRSAAGYKQFTAQFFKDLKVTTYKNICQLIIATRERATKAGQRFEWLDFRKIASGVQEIFNAARLNEYTSKTSSWLASYQAQEHLSLHPH